MRGLLSLLLLTACAPSIEGKDEGAPTPSPTGGPEGTVIDATSETEWIAFDLDAGAEVAETDPWDIGFQRFHIRLNGGASGDGGVDAVLAEGDWDSVTAAPTDGFASDAPDANGDGLPEFVLEPWYIYDNDTHLLGPSDLVFVVRSTEGTPFKLQVLDYYDSAGTPAVHTIRFKEL